VLTIEMMTRGAHRRPAPHAGLRCSTTSTHPRRASLHVWRVLQVRRPAGSG